MSKSLQKEVWSIIRRAWIKLIGCRIFFVFIPPLKHTKEHYKWTPEFKVKLSYAFKPVLNIL